MESIVEQIKRLSHKRYLLGLDLECTCWQANDTSAPDLAEREVIELGMCMLDMDSLSMVGDKSVLIRPTLHPKLSQFCIDLTSIDDTMIANAPGFIQGLADAMCWLDQFDDDYAWCSWGMFDLDHLQHECFQKGIEFPLRSSLHFNAKTIYSASHPKLKRRGMKRALAHEGVTLEGCHHRGVDDARNMVRLIIQEECTRLAGQKSGAIS